MIVPSEKMSGTVSPSQLSLGDSRRCIGCGLKWSTLDSGRLRLDSAARGSLLFFYRLLLTFLRVLQQHEDDDKVSCVSCPRF